MAFLVGAVGAAIAGGLWAWNSFYNNRPDGQRPENYPQYTQAPTRRSTCPSTCPICYPPTPPPRRPPPSPPPSKPISTWSKQEGYDAAAKAFSKITGVTFISQNDVQKQRKLGKKVTPVDIKDVFYGRLSSSQTGANDQEQLYYIPDSAYDPRYDHDFTDYKGDDSSCTRGGYSYKRPAGWNRKAVRVIGKYEDNVWLGKKGWRDESSPGEWWVSYHGTKRENVPGIVANGYDPGKSKRQKYGEGIYSTPDVKVAEYYATEFNYKGKSYKCILQNRVNPEKTETIESDMRKWDYFVTPDKDDIRPYGICLKELELKSRS